MTVWGAPFNFSNNYPRQRGLLLATRYWLRDTRATALATLLLTTFFYLSFSFITLGLIGIVVLSFITSKNNSGVYICFKLWHTNHERNYGRSVHGWNKTRRALWKCRPVHRLGLIHNTQTDNYNFELLFFLKVFKLGLVLRLGLGL